MFRFMKNVAPEKNQIIGEGDDQRASELHRGEHKLPAENGGITPGHPFDLERQNVGEIDDRLGKEPGEGKEDRRDQHDVRKLRAEKECCDGGAEHADEKIEIQSKRTPRLLESITDPDQKKNVKRRVEPVRRWNQAAQLRNKNISNQSPDFAVADRFRIEIDEREVLRLEFVENENQRRERRDVAQ